MTWGRALLPHWMLEEGIAFLNHGSFGATPREVIAAQQLWQHRMEAQPVRFFIEELPVRLREAAAQVAPFVGVAPERFAFVENASTGTNAVLASLRWRPGDRIVTTDHVYNAVRNTLRHLCTRTGAEYFEAPLGLPVRSADQILAAIEQAMTPRTRLLVIDHVASASAVRMPVAEIVALARGHRVPVLVDGAHGPGFLDLDVDALGADWYVGNCHKWLCAPKGSAFLALSSTSTAELHPLVISHAFGQGFTAEFDKVGTRDASSWLATPDAVAFHRRLGGQALRRRNAAVAAEVARAMVAELGTETGADAELFGAMATIRLPTSLTSDRPTAGRIRSHLWQKERIEAAIMPLAGALWLRISVAAYNEASDFAPVPAALRAAIGAVEAGA